MTGLKPFGKWQVQNHSANNGPRVGKRILIVVCLAIWMTDHCAIIKRSGTIWNRQILFEDSTTMLLVRICIKIMSWQTQRVCNWDQKQQHGTSADNRGRTNIELTVKCSFTTACLFPCCNLARDRWGHTPWLLVPTWNCPDPSHGWSDLVFVLSSCCTFWPNCHGCA